MGGDYCGWNGTTFRGVYLMVISGSGSSGGVSEYSVINIVQGDFNIPLVGSFVTETNVTTLFEASTGVHIIDLLSFTSGTQERRFRITVNGEVIFNDCELSEDNQSDDLAVSRYSIGGALSFYDALMFSGNLKIEAVSIDSDDRKVEMRVRTMEKIA